MSYQPVSNASQVRSELDLYLEEPPLPITQELDITTSWKVGGIKYPTLQRIAHDILSIPVTIVASESAFSTSGGVVSPHRSRLALKMVEALMCMQIWCRADMLGGATSNLSPIQSFLEDEEEIMEEEDESAITIS